MIADPLVLLLLCLGLASGLGYLAQTTGLCMVRGMEEWMLGKPGFILAILFSGVLAWVAGLSAAPLGIELPYDRYSLGIRFALGGLLFGIGAAFNQGCGVSTLTRLSRGDLGMLATLSGWLIGWSVLDAWAPDLPVNQIAGPDNRVFGILIALSIVLIAWLVKSKSKRRKLWLGTMGIGLLSGFLFLFERSWSPGLMLHDLSAAIRREHDSPWPSMGRYLIFGSMLAGMSFAGWRAKRMNFRVPRIKAAISHLAAGTMMGIGGALAMGGNTTQLLLALPVFSPAGATAIVGMLAGLFAGLKVIDFDRK